MSVPYFKPTHGLPPPLNSNPKSLYWPTRHCLSLPCPPFSLTFSYMGLLWFLRALQVGFCLRTLAHIFCLELSALNSVLPQSHPDLCPSAISQTGLPWPSHQWPPHSIVSLMSLIISEMCDPSLVFLYVAGPWLAWALPPQSRWRLY